MNKFTMILIAVAMMAITTGCHTTYNRYCDGRPCVHEPAPTVVYPPAPVIVTPAPAIRAPVVNVFAQGLPAGNTFFNPRVEYYGRGRQEIFHVRSEPAARVYYREY